MELNKFSADVNISSGTGKLTAKLIPWAAKWNVSNYFWMEAFSTTINSADRICQPLGSIIIVVMWHISKAKYEPLHKESFLKLYPDYSNNLKNICSRNCNNFGILSL